MWLVVRIHKTGYWIKLPNEYPLPTGIAVTVVVPAVSITDTFSSALFVTPLADGRLIILGYPCSLCAPASHEVPTDMTGSPVAVRQYLLFDPLPESVPRKLLNELVSRMPVLAFKQQVSYEIPNSAFATKREDHGFHNLTYPTFIASHLKPTITAGYSYSKTSRQAVGFLDSELASCPPISDERILAAIDLANATRRESLPRSIFLSWITIIDSLAVHKERSADICDWLDEKIKEAKPKNDDGLLSALSGLKYESHGTAIKKLIGRASQAIGENEVQVKARQGLASKLYATRSGLSHSGTKALDPNEVGQARDLARFLIESAIQHPHILDE